MTLLACLSLCRLSSVNPTNKVMQLSKIFSTDKICAFFLEWKNDSFHEHANTKGHFQLVKQDEKLTDLIAGNLLGPSKGLNKSFSSTNRLLNRGNTFVKDWEVSCCPSE